MKIEIRSDHAIIEGYVNAVARDSRILPKTMSPNAKSNFVENVKPKTFERALSKADNVEVRFNHRKALGSIKEGNLQLYEDNIGLYAKATITDQEVIQKARANELRGWSFGFVANTDKWEDTQEGMQRRVLEDIELREVSILTQTPAYIATSIEMRGEDCIVIEDRGLEEVAEVIDTVPKQEEEREVIDYSIHEQEIEILRLRHH